MNGTETEPIEAMTRSVQVHFRAFDLAEKSSRLAKQFSEPVNADRVIRFRASDESLDRYDEVILAAGWKLENFAKNPVMMQFHDYNSWPIGRVVAAGVKDNALFLDGEFDPPDVDESADLVFRKILHGSIKAGSVGFIPVSWMRPGDAAPNKDASELFAKYPKAKKIYIEQELLEWTICPVPANPNALAAAYRSNLGKRMGAEAIQYAATADAAHDREQAAMVELALRLHSVALQAQQLAGK